MKKKHKILAVVGPSASGKTNLAINLAKMFDGEILSADSRQIYKHLDIATAKPSENEKQNIIHHLIDIVEPNVDYSVAEFATAANRLIKSILQADKTPIIAGGTGLYHRILLEHYALPEVAPNEQLRIELSSKTTDSLYSELSELDPVIAEKIHPNNKVKIIRALEVCKTLHKPMSEAQGLKESDYDVLWLGLTANNREYLYNRANLRVDKMIEEGLLSEFKNLIKKYGNLPIFESTIGYQEFIPYLSNECSFDESIGQIKQNTRRYIKRQLSWFRANKSINWLNVDELTQDEILQKSAELWINFLESENN